MKESKCIICGEGKNGLEVRNDHIIEAVRWFKRKLSTRPTLPWAF